jgi:ADP-ribosylglycohydrolase
VAQVIAERKIITIPAEVIVDKIRGGMLGQCIGNLNGMPHEHRYYDQPGEVQTYTPSLEKGAETDDDTDFEWVYIYNMQKERTAFLPYDAINTMWTKSINRGIWCSNRYARYLMDLGIQPPLTGNVVLNPWAEFNVSGQFLCETFGLVAPAMPQTAAKIGLHYTRVAIEQEPAQTTQLFTTMISSAFIDHDINKLLDAGVASLDPNSIIVQIIDDVRKWHKENRDNFKETRRLLHSKYKLKDGITRNQNGSELNTAAIIAAMLYGNGDFAETIRYGMNFGYDADCNCATLGTIMGTIYGYRQMMGKGWQIIDRYQNTKRDNMPMDETMTSFADRIIELFEMVNQENGGRKYVLDKVVVYDIPVEKPASVINLYSHEEHKQILINQYEKEIEINLLEGNRQETARAAYIAVCMGLNTSLANKYPKKWNEACFNLSGYWKVINNIFNSDNFQSLLDMKAKFAAAGFVPMEKVADSVLFMDMETWKDPKILYSFSGKSK